MKTNQQEFIRYISAFARENKIHIWLGGSFLKGIATLYSDVDISILGRCKRYGRQNSVGVSIVRSMYGVQSSDRVNKSILVTTGHVTRDARKFVEQQNTMMSIIDVDEIHDLIRRSAMKYR